MWLHTLCIIFCGLSLFLNVKYIFTIVNAFGVMKDKYKRHQSLKKQVKYRSRIKSVMKKNRFKTSSEERYNTKLQSDKSRHQFLYNV